MRLPLRPRVLRPCGFTKPPLCLVSLALRVCGHGWCRHHRGSSQALRAASRVVGPPTPGRLLRPASAACGVFPLGAHRQVLPKSNSRATKDQRACTALHAVPRPAHLIAIYLVAACARYTKAIGFICARPLAHQPHPSSKARVQQRCQTVKAYPEP